MSKEGREKIVIGNWKMNLTVKEALTLSGDLTKKMSEGKTEVVIAPSFVDLYPVSEHLKDSHIEIASQNVYHEEQGAYTGEVSSHMLKGLVKYCIVGHSERRLHFGEKDRDIAKKVRSLLSFGIKPIICVGETLKEKNEGLGKIVATSQLEGALNFVAKEDLEDIVIAYEPVWAIGSGKACDPKDAAYVINTIRKFLKALYGEETSKKVRVIYGASVKVNVVQEFLKEDVDGFLVGGASLDADEFAKIIKQME